MYLIHRVKSLVHFHFHSHEHVDHDFDLYHLIKLFQTLHFESRYRIP